MGQTTVTRARSGILEADKIIGCKVENSKGESLGRIENLEIDLQANRVAYAVLSFGGFLGIGDKLFPVPLEALTYSGAGERFIVDLDKDLLRNAPGYDKHTLPNVNDRSWRTRIFTHYGYEPYWKE